MHYLICLLLFISCAPVYTVITDDLNPYERPGVARVLIINDIDTIETMTGQWYRLHLTEK